MFLGAAAICGSFCIKFFFCISLLLVLFSLVMFVKKRGIYEKKNMFTFVFCFGFRLF